MTRSSLIETLMRRGAALRNALATLIVIGAATLYLLLINYFSDNYDEGVYWQSLRAMAAGHPLFTSVFSSQPPYFLVSLYPIYMAFGQSIAAARIGIALFGLIGVIAMYWLASEIAGLWAGLTAAALLAFEPYYLQQARTLESDGPAVAISILAVALAVAASRRAGTTRRWLAFLSGAAVVYGALIKLTGVVAMVPAVLYLATPLYSAFDAGQGRRRRPTSAGLRQSARAALPGLAWLAAGALTAALLLLAPFLGSFSAMWDQVVTFHIAAQKGLPPKLTGDATTVINSFVVLGPLAIIVVGVAIWRRAWWMAIPTLWLLASILMVKQLNPFFDHYTVLVSPGVALVLALAPGLITPAMSRPLGRWLMAAATLVLLAVFVNMAVNAISASASSLSKGTLESAQTRIAAINTFSMPGELIVTDDQYIVAQAGHSVPPDLVDTSYVRITTGYLTASQIERVIERDNIRVIVLGTNRLVNLPGFMPWLRSHYALAAHAGKGYDIYIRVPSGSSVA